MLLSIKMKELTIFTPTYNRAYLLPRLYQSLCNQTNKNFIWLVIDDGSTDNTKKLIEEWKSEDKISIQYHWKENGGMHTGHNAAYSLISTELNVCIDSDDMMPENAVELILNNWNSLSNKTNIAGIIGLDADINNIIIGTKIPEQLTQGNLIDLYKKYNVSGDKKLVLRTEIVKEFPLYPEFHHEKLVPLGTLYRQIGNEYDFIYSNEVYCIVEYQDEGSSASILKQYKQSPRGFAYARTIEKKISTSFLEEIKSSIHLVSSSIFANDYSLLNKGPKVYLNYLLFPLGCILNQWIKRRLK